MDECGEGDPTNGAEGGLKVKEKRASALKSNEVRRMGRS